MPQTSSLIATLKGCLKAKGITYADVARELGLSEASIKRIFAEETLSLERLDRVCQMLGMEISELVKEMEAARNQLTHLTHQQEREIADDLELMLVTVCVFNHWNVNDITRYFTLSRELCIRKLLKLEKIGLIELLTGDRVRLLINKHFEWQPGGPFEQFFRQHIGREYFSRGFDGDASCLHVLNMTLTKASAAEFQRKLQRLAREFSEINREDANRPVSEREGITLVMAMRHWDYGLFEHLIR